MCRAESFRAPVCILCRQPADDNNMCHQCQQAASGDNDGCRPYRGNFHHMLAKLFRRPVDGRPGSITITARRRVPALEPQLCHVRHYIAITITTRRSVPA